MCYRTAGSGLCHVSCLHLHGTAGVAQSMLIPVTLTIHLKEAICREPPLRLLISPHSLGAHGVPHSRCDLIRTCCYRVASSANTRLPSLVHSLAPFSALHRNSPPSDFERGGAIRKGSGETDKNRLEPSGWIGDWLIARHGLMILKLSCSTAHSLSLSTILLLILSFSCLLSLASLNERYLHHR